MSIVFNEDDQKRDLTDLKEQEEEEVVQLLAESKFGLPYANLTLQQVSRDALLTVAESEARQAQLVPFKLIGKNLMLAVISPELPQTKSVMETLAQRGFAVSPVMVSQKSLAYGLDFYKDLSLTKNTTRGSFDIAEDALAAFGEKVKHVGDVPKLIEELAASGAKVSQILEAIMGGAISTNASDVHIEPEEKSVRVRYRIDGLLQDIAPIKSDLYKMLNSRIKLLSSLKLTITNTSQDGRFSIFINNIEINIRVSFIPGAYGESIVMRLLDPRATQVELEAMGMDKKLFAATMEEIKKPNGLILNTGPTGSGKTTTLYAFLRRIYTPEMKIITIEDPIEYHLAGITQTQVDHKKGYDFLSGLRAALRQDPDVIMIGEIRDAETAKTAIDAALTGHLVLSTLHTNNAAGVIPRLIDLEVNAKIIPSALTLSIAQRLVRKLCPACKKESTLNADDEKLVRDIIKAGIEEGKDFASYNISADMPLNVWEPVGCEKCNNTGYKGRVGVFEIIRTDANIEKIIAENPSEREIKKVAEQQHIFDMKEDGVVKILSGITSLEELRSVVDLLED